MRPIPELGCYRMPIPNIYMCGASSHPGPGVSMAPGRNAAQVIFADLNLDFRNIVADNGVDNNFLSYYTLSGAGIMIHFTPMFHKLIFCIF